MTDSKAAPLTATWFINGLNHFTYINQCTQFFQFFLIELQERNQCVHAIVHTGFSIKYLFAFWCAVLNRHFKSLNVELEFMVSAPKNPFHPDNIFFSILVRYIGSAILNL